MRTPYPNELMHYGVLGQKWGVRRYQNPDGTLTPEGKQKYLTDAHYGAVKKVFPTRKDFVDSTLEREMAAREKRAVKQFKTASQKEEKAKTMTAKNRQMAKRNRALVEIMRLGDRADKFYAMDSETQKKYKDDFDRILLSFGSTSVQKAAEYTMFIENLPHDAPDYRYNTGRGYKTVRG